MRVECNGQIERERESDVEERERVTLKRVQVLRSGGKPLGYEWGVRNNMANTPSKRGKYDISSLLC